VLASVLALICAGACDAAPPAAKAGSGPTPAATTPAPRFRDAAGAARLDRAPQALVLTNGHKVDVSSWRFEPAPGRSEARNTYWCGVQVDGRPLTVIGVGSTETLSCGGLAEIGALSKGRIGLIYRTSSPNAASLTSVILTEAAGAWAIDEKATERLSETSPATLAALRRAIR
jgi:hypothetical protein